MMRLLTKKPPFWLASIALCLFLSCRQNVISVDPETTATVQQGPIGPAEDLDTPLHRAIIEQADLDYINILLQTIDQPDNQAETALHLAASQGNLELIKMLLAHRADVQAKNIQGQTPLHLAALARHPEAIQILLDYRATIEAKDSLGRTPLHLATLTGQVEAIQVLLSKKAPVVAKDKLAQTPLHLAALEGQPETVHLLLDHQAPVGAIDYKGRTPYDLADLVGSQAVKQLLGCHMNLSKLIFHCDYDNIGTRILGYLTTKDRGKLRQTCTEIGRNLLQHGAFCLQVTPDKLRHLPSSTYPRLYPHKRSHQDSPLAFHPIPADAVVRGVWDWQYISNDKHLLIKNVVFIGKKVRTLQQLRKALPKHLSDNLIVPEEILAKEKEKETVYEFIPSAKESSEDPYEFSKQQPEYSSSEEIEPADIANQIYSSFVGVKKLPVGKVIIGECIGRGTFGKVFRGQWDNKPIALKQIDLNHATSKLSRAELEEAMQWEVACLSTTSHPNLVQFYGLYQDQNEDYTYMVMEFCEGGTLQGALEKEDVPWSQRWRWAIQISEALAYLHQEGVLHRDLKAENILLDRNGRAKLADLGLAQVDVLLQEAEAKVVEKGLLDGRFIAPENVTQGAPSSKATDVYALGLVIWQLVTVREPIKLRQFLYQWKHGNPIEREKIPDDCPEGIKQVILECWEHDPDDRPTAQGVLAKLAALGPELDPHHHRLVTAAQKLEKLVHPKRKEGRAYIPPFVTQYNVDESIETYWNRVETAKAKGESAPNQPITLAETFKEFIETPNAHTLLLLGEAGLGKTLTTYQWGDQLLNQWWPHINAGALAPAYFPIFIRPEIPTWSHAGIKGAFQEIASKYNLPKEIQPLVFIDGYDELQQHEEPTNLVEHLGLLGNTKLIVTCRPNTVEKSALETRFGFKGALTTRYFLPFSLDQLLSYLQQERSREEAVYQECKKILEEAESVRTVLRNPFVLHLFRESWETLSQRPLAQLNRWQIYEGFIEHTIKSHKTLLSKMVRKCLKNGYSNLLSSYQAFMSEVAWQSFQQKGITLGWEEAKGLSPWADLSRYIERTSKDEFAQQRAKLAKLDPADEKEKGQLTRRSLLSEADYVSLKQKRGAQAEAELPLKLRGGGKDKQCEYSHKSLFEYGLAKRLLLLKNSPNIVEEGISLLNSRKIQDQPEALQFWQEGWKEPGSEVLIEPFFVLITRSRDKETLQQASANAATLLAQADVPFSGRPLQEVRLPGADLSGAVLSHTCLAGAQLLGAHLRDVYLGNTDLRGANLSDVDLSQYPNLKCKDEVLCLSYNPSGTQLALGLYNGDIELYNQAEGSYTPLTTLKGHIKGVNSVAYRPDGQQLASGSDDHTVGLWDPHRQQLITKLQEHTGEVLSVTYRPDGQQLASGSEDHTIALWDTNSFQLITWLRGHSGRVRSVCYRPDGQQLASGGNDNTVCLWDPASQQQLAQLKGHRDAINSVCYRPDGQQLASGSYDNTVGLWDVHRQQLISLLKGHTGNVRSVTYRPDGQQLASGSYDNTVGLWDPHYQQLISLLKGHTDMVWSVTYLLDGQQLASGSSDKTVGLWNPHGQEVITRLKGHDGMVWSVIYCPDGQQLASGSSDETVCLWDPNRQQLLAQLKGHSGVVRSVCYRPDGQQLASGSNDHTVCLWDPHRQQLLAQLKGHSGWVRSVCYRPDGQQLASGSYDNTVGLWDVQRQQLTSLLRGHTRDVNSVTYRPDGRQLASGSQDSTVGLWDPHRQELISLLKGHNGWVLSVAYRPDGQQLASGSYDSTVGLWDTHSQQLLAQLKGHSGVVRSVCYRPDGQQLASGSEDKTVCLWDTNTFQLVTWLKGHIGRVSSLCYRPDGQQLASGSVDNSIFVWARQDTAGSLPEIWQLIHRFENAASLAAPGALLTGATISRSNRALLKQKGAQDDEDVPDHPPLR